MAYLILADKNGEFDRRDLQRDAVVIGRATDCTICVRDILLSRKHCRIEPFGDRWVASDLGSKNGTRFDHEMITRHVLSDGDVLKIGRIQVCFRAGKFVPPPKEQQRKPEVRPIDPKEALAGTVSGFQYFDMEEDSRVSGFPIPKPKPADPASYRQDEVHQMVTQMSSSQWDLALSEPDIEMKASGQVPAPVAKRQREIQHVRKNSGIFESLPAPTSAFRSPSPDRRGTIPRWLAWAYVVLTIALVAASLAVIVLRSMPS